MELRLSCTNPSESMLCETGFAGSSSYVIMQKDWEMAGDVVAADV